MTPEPNPRAAIIRRNGLIVLAVAILGLGFVAVLMVAVVITTGPKQPDPQRAAWTACQAFVRERLTAPSVAQFQGYAADAVRPYGAGGFQIASHVDARNAFNVPIRTTYTCAVVPTDANRHRLIDLQIVAP